MRGGGQLKKSGTFVLKQNKKRIRKIVPRESLYFH